ncbi:MAG: DHH family phosphoesterase [Pseudomonadota bacterium]
MNYDIFNGDADGICALIQLRLAEPRAAELVTGVKRDVSLVRRLPDTDLDYVTVLDVSLDKNREDVVRVLGQGGDVFYCDHHFPGEVPVHENFDVLIKTDANVCTSILINERLKGAHTRWAIVGAFGDNLDTSAAALARPLNLDAATFDLYKRLGTYANYNGYGSVLEDLHFHPAELFQLMACYSRPEQFVSEAATSFSRLENGYIDDMAQAEAVTPVTEMKEAAVFTLPDAPWSRRVSGVFGNELAKQHPDRAHAVLTEKATGDYLVSVRAPLSDKRDADTICRQFDTGGGRAAAAGINSLPAAELGRLEQLLSATYG